MNNKRDLSILMIEDDPDDRYITEAAFRESNYQITIDFLTAPHDLIGYLKDTEQQAGLPSLIIIDRQLPGIDGLEILRQLKASEEFGFIPAVMISGTAYPKIVDESYRLGVNSFIQKPDSGRLTTDRIEAFINYWFGIVDLPNIGQKTEHEKSEARKRYIVRI
ncbi:MAG: response regulator [Chitinophagaceae bacterium]|nr:MAG: response regulator [Chitinophagaceae bacterium]